MFTTSVVSFSLKLGHSVTWSLGHIEIPIHGLNRLHRDLNSVRLFGLTLECYAIIIIKIRKNTISYAIKVTVYFHTTNRR